MCSKKKGKLLSQFWAEILEFDGVGKYLFENQIANAKQASKQAICHSCRLRASNTHTVYVVNEAHASIKAHPFLQLFYGTFYNHSLDLGS